METDNRLPTGEWNGFYVESHQPKRGWMHLYLSFDNGSVKGEGTDYVGPWIAEGKYDLEARICHWEKRYIGRHRVNYSGLISDQGIRGQWEIAFLTGPFHIWPKGMNQFDEIYLHQELDQPDPTVLWEPIADFAST